MTDEQFEDGAERMVDVSRKVFRGAAESLEAKGVRLEDVAIGLALAAQDVASRLKGDHHAAIEWLRTVADVQERALLGQARHG